MNPEQEYLFSKKTVQGEIRYEVYSKFGQQACDSAHYGWHHQQVNESTEKIYNLVNSNPVKFLLGTVNYSLISASLYTNEQGPGILVRNSEKPEIIYFAWADANIPFLEKDQLDKNNIPYSLEITGSMTSSVSFL